MGARPAPPGVAHRDQGGRGTEDATGPIGDATPRLHGRTVWLSPLRQATRLGLDGELRARAPISRPRATERRDRQHDQTGDFEEPLLVRAEAGVADHQIGAGGQVHDLGITRVADDRPLGRGKEAEEGAAVRSRIGSRGRPAP